MNFGFCKYLTKYTCSDSVVIMNRHQHIYIASSLQRQNRLPPRSKRKCWKLPKSVSFAVEI